MNKEERSIAVDEAEQVQDGNGVTILDFFNAVRKHVITAVVTLVIVMVAICAYTFTRTPQYTATSEFLATYRSSAAASGASSNAVELSYWRDSCRPRRKTWSVRECYALASFLCLRV